MRRILRGFVIASVLPVAGAFASPVIETEANGQAANNSRATAQMLPLLAFSINADPNVFGNRLTVSVSGNSSGNDVDFYRFDTMGGPAYFDIDGTSGPDTYLALFDSAGTVVGDNDDSNAPDPGSSTGLDSFLGVIALGPGTYYVAVASGGNSAAASFSGSMFTELFRPDGGVGGFAFLDADTGIDSFARSDVQLAGQAYTLNITIPAPGTALAAVGALAFLRRRR